MPKCQIKTGFFVLRDCKNPAIGNCINCTRLVCEVHSTMDEGELWCFDCLAKVKNRGKVHKNIDRWHRDRDHDDYHDWYYVMRTDFWDEHAYRPFEHMKTEDYQGFELKGEHLYEESEADEGGFFDS